MKNLLIVTAALILGVIATQVFAQQVSVNVNTGLPGQSVLVQPRGYNVVVPQVYRVQPPPYMVTPYYIPRPPKPIFKTPLRDKIWRHKNPPRMYYRVSPVQ